MGSGLVTLFEATGTRLWLEEAMTLAGKMIAEFWDAEEGGFYYTGVSGEQLIVRTKDYFDNATPSGNSVAVELLLRLSVSGDEDKGVRRRRISPNPRSDAQYPSASATPRRARFYPSSPKEVVLWGPRTEESASWRRRGGLRRTRLWVRWRRRTGRPDRSDAPKRGRGGARPPTSAKL